jgi:hypothetical protein
MPSAAIDPEAEGRCLKVRCECEALVQEGDEFLRGSDLDQAERAYRRAAEADPRSAEALRSVAYVLLLRRVQMMEPVFAHRVRLLHPIRPSLALRSARQPAANETPASIANGVSSA